MNIAVASGKGGTGKTMVSVNLVRIFDTPVTLLDCDVEEPNDHLFIRGTPSCEEIVSILVPLVKAELCNSCGECGRVCQFSAIVPGKGMPLVFADMCHGCGACTKACPTGAISETSKRIGHIQEIRSSKITLIQGCMDVGESFAPPIIRALRSHTAGNMTTLLDSPPGTACTVVATLQGVDVAVLITEPTPFGFHDLKLAIALVRELAIPFGVVINRMGIGDHRVHAFCEARGIPLLLEIPDDRRIAEACSRGEVVVETLPEYRPLFSRLLTGINSIQSKNEVSK